MQTLFMISSSAFVVAALSWFSTWAFWIHPPEGWIGKEYLSVRPLVSSNAIRHAAWFRQLKIVTVILGLITLGLFVLLVIAQIGHEED